MKVVRTALVIACLVGCAAVALAAGDADKATEATIRAQTSSWFKAYNAGDAEAVVALYAEDAVVMPPGSPAARGHKAIREFLVKDIAGSKAQGVTLALGSTHDVAIAGDLAWDSGSYTVRDKSGATVDSGSFLAVWRKEGGKWHTIRDIWNSDRPAAPAK